jgi:hypothetical protein
VGFSLRRKNLSLYRALLRSSRKRLTYGVASRVGVDQLSEFATPVSGIDSVTNATASSGGSELES